MTPKFRSHGISPTMNNTNTELRTHLRLLLTDIGDLTQKINVFNASFRSGADIPIQSEAIHNRKEPYAIHS